MSKLELNEDKVESDVVDYPNYIDCGYVVGDRVNLMSIAYQEHRVAMLESYLHASDFMTVRDAVEKQHYELVDHQLIADTPVVDNIRSCVTAVSMTLLSVKADELLDSTSSFIVAYIDNPKLHRKSDMMVKDLAKYHLHIDPTTQCIAPIVLPEDELPSAEMEVEKTDMESLWSSDDMEVRYGINSIIQTVLMSGRDSLDITDVPTVAASLLINTLRKFSITPYVMTGDVKKEVL